MCARVVPTDRTLRWVAHLYRKAVAVSLDPTMMIEQTFQLKRSTTGCWFGKARQAGYLGRAGRGTRDSNGTSASSASARYQARWVDPKLLGVLQKSSPVARSPRTRSPSLRPASLTGATSTTRTRSRLSSTPGIGPATPSAPLNHDKAGQVLIQVPITSTKLGARKVSAARPSEVQAWVTERSQTPSPGTVRLLVQAALSLQMPASKIVSWRAVRGENP
jgi:hypothetical protein